MPYHSGRVIHDADAHVMETSDWVRDFADPDIRDRMAPLRHTAVDKDPEKAEARIQRWIQRTHTDPDLVASEEAEIMDRKNWFAPGSMIAEDRPRALDELGFASQLIFNSFHNGYLQRLEARVDPDLDLVYGAARAHNRAMVDFCSVDERLLPTCYLPLADPERSRAFVAEAIDGGAAGLLIAQTCTNGHSPSHVDLDPVWAAAQEAALPILFHVGGGGTLLDPAFFNNGLPIPPDFHGGDENFRSVSYMAICGPPMQALATLIFDGVLERFPDLRFGAVELGASWMPSWIKNMESAMVAFGRLEDRLKALSLRPTEYVQRQVRATPYPTEDVGWILDEVGPDVLLFSSDYPHVEGGKRPIERFEASLGDRSDAVRERFYRQNFVDLMGAGLPARVAAAA